MIIIVNKSTPISEQLRMIKILSALVLYLFYKCFQSNTPFEKTVAKAVNIEYICNIKISAQ